MRKLCGWLVLENRLKFLNCSMGLGKRSQFLLDAAAGIENGRVVAATEELADASKRLGSVLTEQVHGNMAGVGDVPGA